MNIFFFFRIFIDWVSDWFVAECGAAGMRISISKSEAVVLSQQNVECSPWVGEEILLQVQQYLRVL